MEPSFEEEDSGWAARMEAMRKRTEPCLAGISRVSAEGNAEDMRPARSEGDAIEERLTAALSTLSDNSKHTKMMLEDLKKEKEAHREERLLLEAKRKEVEALEEKLLATAREARKKRDKFFTTVATMALGALVVFFVARQGTPPAGNGLDVFRYVH